MKHSTQHACLASFPVLLFPPAPPSGQCTASLALLVWDSSYRLPGLLMPQSHRTPLGLGQEVVAAVVAPHCYCWGVPLCPCAEARCVEVCGPTSQPLVLDLRSGSCAGCADYFGGGAGFVAGTRCNSSALAMVYAALELGGLMAQDTLLPRQLLGRHHPTPPLTHWLVSI